MVWVRIFLKKESIINFVWSTVTLSLLYPMEKLFESYVANRLKTSGLFDDIKTQDWSFSLIEDHDSKKKFYLRPDIVATKSWWEKVILDTKWKEIDENDTKNNYNISQQDMYQLYAYARKYKSKELYLIYPKTEKFCWVIPPFIYHVDKWIWLKAVCYDLLKNKMEFNLS